MPHTRVKLWTGHTEQDKQRLAKAITREVMTRLNYGAESVSVALEEVAPQDWAAQVYRPDLQAKWDQRYKKPDYTM